MLANQRLVGQTKTQIRPCMWVHSIGNILEVFAQVVCRISMELPVRFGSVRFQLKPVPVPPVRFRADVFSGTDVLGIFQADVISSTDVLGDFPGRCFFLDQNLKNWKSLKPCPSCRSRHADFFGQILTSNGLNLTPVRSVLRFDRFGSGVRFLRFRFLHDLVSGSWFGSDVSWVFLP